MSQFRNLYNKILNESIEDTLKSLIDEVDESGEYSKLINFAKANDGRIIGNTIVIGNNVIEDYEYPRLEDGNEWLVGWYEVG